MDKKTIGIIATVATALLCGCPGLFLCGTGVLAMIGVQMPEVMAQSGANPSDTMLGSVLFLCVGVILIAIPIVVGVVTLRKKPEALVSNEPLPPAS